MSGQNRVLVAAGIGAAVVIAALVLWPSDDETRAPSPAPAAAAPAPPPSAAPAPVRMPQEPAPRVAGAPAPSAEAPPAPAEAFELVEPEGLRVRCHAPLPGGPYEGVGLARVWLEGGWLHASVATAEGSGVVTQHLGLVGTVTWTGAEPGGWGSCTFAPPERVAITGRVTLPDGSPAAGVRVRTCDHGTLVNTDAEGRFRFQAARGVTCHPMAFGEDARGFGKGSYTELVVDAPTELALTVPDPSEWMSDDALAAMAGPMGSMFGRMLDGRRAEPPAEVEVLAGEAGSPAARAVLERWVDAWDQRIADMEAQLEALDDPETSAQAVREAWLDQY